MPPAVDLSASPVQAKMASNSAPIQRTGNPEIPKADKAKAEYGPASAGPIAEKGGGDAHAFAANDVNQGGLGDCYLLASLVTLANTNPGLLQSAISAKSDGTYDVSLYKRSGFLGMGGLKKQTVNVTSEFVVSKAWGTPMYAQDSDRDAAGNSEIWVKLIEKAYAKMHGGYKKIDGGWEEDALEVLTGKEHSRHGFRGGLFGIGKMSDADLKKNIKEAVTAGKPVTSSTTSQGDIDKADKKAGVTFAADNDIVGHHAYAVMAADDTKIRLRNPWGGAASNPEPELTWAQFRTYYRDYTTQD